MKKRILSLLVALALVLSPLAGVSMADDSPDQEDINVEMNDDSEDDNENDSEDPNDEEVVDDQDDDGDDDQDDAAVVDDDNDVDDDENETDVDDDNDDAEEATDDDDNDDVDEDAEEATDDDDEDDEDEVVRTVNDRISGDDRIATAIEISKEQFGDDDDAEAVIIVRHDIFPDSLTATVLAEKEDAPILLNPTAELDARVKAEIERLGVDEIFIVGGNSSISEDVENELNEFDEEIVRIQGKDRFETSANVMKAVLTDDDDVEDDDDYKVIIASGYEFPDALAMSPYAADNNYPILLVGEDSVSEEIQEALNEFNIENTIVVGGKNTVSEAVEEALPGVEQRISGADRYETAANIADAFYDDADLAYIASGEVFADALVVGPLAAENDAPILLSASKTAPETVKDLIQNSGIESITPIGGKGTLPEATVEGLLK